MLRMLRIEASPLRKHLARVRERARTFFENFPNAKVASRSAPPKANHSSGNHEAFEDLAAAVKRIETELSALSPKPEEVITLARRASELRREFAFLLESEEKSYVYWYERRGKGVILTATPIDVSQILREHLFDRFDTVILTSATLAVGGHFDYLKQRLGVQAPKEKALKAGVRLPRTGSSLHSERDARRAPPHVFRRARTKSSSCSKFRKAAPFAFSPVIPR